MTELFRRMARVAGTALLLAVVATGVQAAFSPVAVASSCGAGEELCDSSENGSIDRICVDVFRFFKLCVNYYYYYPPADDNEGNDGTDHDGETDGGPS